MHPFKLHTATSIDSLADLITGAADPKFLSGGMTLLPSMKLGLIAPTDLVDISKLPGFTDIAITGKRVRIGAAATHVSVADHAGLLLACPAICAAARSIGDRHIRNRGTIGGSLANNDPAADYPAAVLALDATVETVDRTIAADDYFRGLFQTALTDNELITGISFDVPDAATYEKFPHPATGFALVGVFIARRGGSVRVAVTGASQQGVFRVPQMEERLSRAFSMTAVGTIDFSDVDLFEDRLGSRAYRANLIHVLARRAVARLSSANGNG